MDDVAERLWRRVDRSGDCWIWTGNHIRGGYGHISRNGRAQLTHRVAWEITSGPIPEGLCVLHRCDNPPCCNPEHLFLGTQKDNVRDMAAKGRHGRYSPAGSKNPRAKLTESQAADIRDSPRGYGTGRILARKYGVSEATVSLIRSGHHWPTGAPERLAGQS